MKKELHEMKKTLMAFALLVGTAVVTYNTFALPQYPTLRTYYSDSSKTEEIGWKFWGCTLSGFAYEGSTSAHGSNEVLYDMDCTTLGIQEASDIDHLKYWCKARYDIRFDEKIPGADFRSCASGF